MITSVWIVWRMWKRASYLSRYFVFWERCGAITGAVPGSRCIVDGILVRICQVMGGFWPDGLVLYEVRRDITSREMIGRPP